jgi:hypothetical protein
LAHEPEKVPQTMRSEPGKRLVFIPRYDKIEQNQSRIEDAEPIRASAKVTAQVILE